MEDEQPEATRPKRPLSYAEIVAIHKSCEDVSFAPTSQLRQQPLEQQPRQSNTLPRSKRKPRGAGAGTATNRNRTSSGSYQQENVEGGQRSQPSQYNGPRGGGRGRGSFRGGSRPFGPSGPSDKPQFEGGISRDNPQYHTFPRSRRRQPPDPEKLEAQAQPRRDGHVGPSQRRILSRRQHQKEHPQQPHYDDQSPDDAAQDDLSFSQILKSRSSSLIPAQQVNLKPETEFGLETDSDRPVFSSQFTRSYASTLASGLEILRKQQAELARRMPTTRIDTSSIYKSQPILVFKDPWSDQPPPAIPGLRFRPAKPLERRNSKKQRQSQEFTLEDKQEEAIAEAPILETQTLKRRRSKKKRAPAKRSKSCGDEENPEHSFKPLDASMKSTLGDEPKERTAEGMRKPVRRRSKKFQKKETDTVENETAIEEKEPAKKDKVTKKEEKSAKPGEQLTKIDDKMRKRDDKNKVKDDKPTDKETRQPEKEEKILVKLEKTLKKEENSSDKEEKPLTQINEESKKKEMKPTLKEEKLKLKEGNPAGKEEKPTPKKEKPTHKKEEKPTLKEEKPTTKVEKQIKDEKTTNNTDFTAGDEKKDETGPQKRKEKTAKKHTSISNLSGLVTTTNGVSCLKEHETKKLEEHTLVKKLMTEKKEMKELKGNNTGKKVEDPIKDKSEKITMVEKTVSSPKDQSSEVQKKIVTRETIATFKVEIIPNNEVTILKRVKLDEKNVLPEKIVPVETQWHESKEAIVTEVLNTECVPILTEMVVESKMVVSNIEVGKSQISYQSESPIKFSHEEEIVEVPNKTSFAEKTEMSTFSSKENINEAQLPVVHKELTNESVITSANSEELVKIALDKVVKEVKSEPSTLRATIAASNVHKSKPEDTHSGDNSDFEVMQSPALIVEVMDNVPVVIKDEDDNDALLSKKKLKERNESSFTADLESTVDIVKDILKVDLERSPKQLQASKQHSTEKSNNSSDEEFFIIEEVEPNKIEECKTLEVKKLLEVSSKEAKQLEELKDIMKVCELEKAATLETATKLSPTESKPIKISEVAKINNQGSSISSFDESQGINTGEEDIYWRIKEKVKKKRRRPKQTTRESSTESESELTIEMQSLKVKIVEKIHSPIPENVLLLKSEDADSLLHIKNDEAAHVADVEDNVSIGKFAASGPTDEVESDKEDFVSVDLNEEFVNKSAVDSLKTWASIASMQIRPSTPLPAEESVQLRKPPVVCLIADQSVKLEHIKDPEGFEIVSSKRHRQKSTRISESDDAASDLLSKPTVGKKETKPGVCHEQGDEKDDLCPLEVNDIDNIVIPVKDTVDREEEEEEDSCPIEPLVNDTDEEDLPMDGVEFETITSKVEAVVMESAIKKTEEAKEEANKTLAQEEDDDDDSCPIEPFLEDNETEKACLSTFRLVETSTKIVGILDKLSTMVNNNAEKIQAQIELAVSEGANTELPECTSQTEHGVESEVNMDTTEPSVLEESKQNIIETTLKTKIDQNEMSTTATPLSKEELESPIGPTENELVKESATGDNGESILSVPAIVKHASNSKSEKIGLEGSLPFLNQVKQDAEVVAQAQKTQTVQNMQDEESDSDSCPIEPFLEDLEGEIVEAKVSNQMEVNPIQHSEPIVKLSLNKDVIMELQKTDTKPIEDEESDDDSCPIEPFLEESDGEKETRDVPSISDLSTCIQAQPKEESKYSPSSKEQLLEVTDGPLLAVCSKTVQLELNEDSDDDSCPIEPFLEESDSEIPEVVATNQTEASPCKQQADTKTIEGKQSVNDSCLIEPLRKDKDRNEATKDKKMKSWADIANLVKPEPVSRTTDEDEVKVSNPLLPTIFSAEEEKDATSGIVDLEGFQKVHTKKDLKRTRTLSSKTIQEALSNISSESKNEKDGPSLKEQFLEVTEENTLVASTPSENESTYKKEEMSLEIPLSKLQEPKDETAVLIVSDQTIRTKTVKLEFNEESDDDSCPIEPFLEESDAEIAVVEAICHSAGIGQVSAIKDIAGDEKKADTKSIEAEESDDDSCPIEPFMEDSDGEETIKDEISKSWADIASSVKPEAILSKTEEKEEKVAKNHLTTVLAVEKEKDASNRNVDAEGFKVVLSKKDWKRTRTLSSKSIDETITCNITEHLQDEKIKEEKMAEQIETICTDENTLNLEKAQDTPTVSNLSILSQSQMKVGSNVSFCSKEQFCEVSKAAPIISTEKEMLATSHLTFQAHKTNSVVIIPDQTIKTDTIQLELNEESDDDSCPIEPFLEESDAETAEVEDICNSTNVGQVRASLDVTDDLERGNTKQMEEEESDDDSCPIEPFLEDSDGEEATEQEQEKSESVKIEASNQTKANTIHHSEVVSKVSVNEDVTCDVKQTEGKHIQEEESDDDSCPIEPFMEDSDDEEVEKSDKSKSWADIASLVKPQPVSRTVEEKEAKIFTHIQPSIVVVEEEKVSFTEIVDPEGFKAVMSKKNRTVMCSLSSKSIQDAVCSIPTDCEAKESENVDNTKSSNDVTEEAVSQEMELPLSWAKVVTSVIPTTQTFYDSAKTQTKISETTHIPDILVIAGTDQSNNFTEFDEDGFVIVHSKAEKNRSRLSSASISKDTIAEAKETETELAQVAIVKEDNFDIHEEKDDDKTDSSIPVTGIFQSEGDQEGLHEEKIPDILVFKNAPTKNDLIGASVETSVSSSLWAKVAALPAAAIKAACEETKANLASSLDGKVPEIIVPLYMQEPNLKIDETDSEGFKPVHSKKDRKRTRTISIKSVEKVVEESQAFETTVHDDSVVEVPITSVTTNISADVEEQCTSNSWAKIASIQPTLKVVTDAESKAEQQHVKDIKIPEVVVPLNDQESKSADAIENVDADGFKTVVRKKELPFKSSKEEIEAKEPCVANDSPKSESQKQITPIIDTQVQPSSEDKIKVKKTEPRKADNETNFQVKASKSLSVPVAEDCKPPDPYKYLRQEHVWINKQECEEAEIRWHSQKSYTTKESQAIKDNKEHDDKGPKPDKGGGGGDGSDRPTKKSVNISVTGKTEDTSSDHPKGKGNWSDESTYLRLDPLAKVLSDSDTSESENYDSGYNSLRRGEGTLQLSCIDQKEQTKKKSVINVEAELHLKSPVVDTFKAKLEEVNKGLCETMRLSISKETLDGQIAVTKMLTKILDSFDKTLVELSKELIDNDDLLTTTLPSDLIRTQIKLKCQQDNLKSQTAQLANLAEERTQNSFQIRRYREFLAVLEDWLIQTQNSVSAELKLFANLTFRGNIQILETLDEEISNRQLQLEDFGRQCQPLAAHAVVGKQAGPLYAQLTALKSSLANAKSKLHVT